MMLETMAALSDDPVVGLPAMVIRPIRPEAGNRHRQLLSYTAPWDTIRRLCLGPPRAGERANRDGTGSISESPLSLIVDY
jgi:hypothetical protein